ncbi:ABC transporter substrate-binding protein [Arthrobacter sp. Sa2CUA1]|uniref:ABC transporter substrate-binding protein n=1 Tax=Arthrobacter gallicola TaxID=2762225 RepID=A0ABR8UQD0_9MICC|nr:ABC transporter substrate-binding protein [Arthrobacter gallicola]MBD7994751.1 ABC transporter substrate-binding protein [Arthrobacter gallicola]
MHTSSIPPSRRPRRTALLGAALLGPALLGLAGCADPGTAAAGQADGASPSAAAASGFNLTPEQNRFTSDVSGEAQALLPDEISADGKLTVAVNPFAAPLAVYASDNTTPIGNEVDIAYALADSLGLEADVVPVAWADWPLGVESGKYEAVISNVTVTEERKQKFDFASYRNDLLGFYAKADSAVSEITEAGDVAGLRVIVGSGTNQEKILLEWDAQNQENGLQPVEFQYYDDDSASSLALQSGRADVTFGPNATGAYKAKTDGETKLVGTVEGGWPAKANIAVTTRKGNGFAVAAQAGLNHLIDNGTYARILDRWGLAAEAIEESELNPPGLGS